MKEETEYLTHELKDGIIIAQFKPDLKIDLKMAKEMVRDRIEFQRGVEYPVLIHFTTYEADKEARDYMNIEGLELISKGAFFTDSILTTMFVNFYLKVYKPKVPTKMFTNKEKAIAWLKKD